MTLGCSPPNLCICGHHVDDHLGWYGDCNDCTCPLYTQDEDR